MRHLPIIGFLLAAGPALAGVDEVIDDHILPGYAGFAAETAELAAAAEADCAPGALREAWNAAFDAWLGVSHLTFGPIEKQGRLLTVAFWPDSRGATPRALAGLIAEADPIIETAEGTAQVSAAARGLFALEFLLYDPAFAEGGAYGCDLIRALTADLARIAGEVEAEWVEGYADTLRNAGDPGNEVFLSGREARQVLFTALTTGLEFTADQRLGRPLGTFERPRPTRAEAWRSGRSLRNVALSVEANRELARLLADMPTPLSDDAFDRAAARAEALDDPALAGVATPQGRLRVEILRQAVDMARDAVRNEIGPALGVAAGFNSADGD